MGGPIRMSNNDDFNKRAEILESIYNNIDQGIALHKVIYENGAAVDYKIIDVNPAYEDKLDISREKAVGSLGSELYQTDKPPYLEKFVEVAESGGKESFEDYFNPLDAYFEITVTAPERGYFITLFDDITARKERLGKLEDQKEELVASYQQLEAYSEVITAMNDSLSNKIDEVNQLNNRFNQMISLISDLNLADYNDEEKFLSNLLSAAVEIIPEADYGSVYTYEEGEVNFVDAIGHDLIELQKIDIPAKIFYNQEEIKIIDVREVSSRDKSVLQEQTFYKLKDAINLLDKIITFDLEVDGDNRAGISLDIALDEEASISKDSKEIIRSFYNLSNTFFKIEEYNSLYNDFTKRLITSIVGLLEVYDEYTSGHSENVAQIAVEIAKELDLSESKKNLVYWSGMVHDIGKLLIPLEILNKPDKLNEEEYKVIKKHPKWGYEALQKSSLNIGEYIRHHHENWDGTGYPDGLKGEEIPLVSQILSVADAWDAMTSTRAYRSSLSEEKALREIKDNKGSQFSPQIVEAFLNIKEETLDTQGGGVVNGCRKCN
mgnify:FL=1